MNLHKTKRRILLITTSKENCCNVLPNIITSSTRYNAHPSNAIVLLACILRKPNMERKQWNHEDYIKLKQCKPNILKTTNHYESIGYYASFRNKGSFDKATLSSVGQYSSKRKDSLSKQCIVNDQALYFEKLCADEINRSVSDLTTFLPNMRTILSPVIEAALFIQQQKEIDLNLKETISSNDGCFQSSICVNAETKQYHTEHDCTYTLISIPKQPKSSTDYDFLFTLTSKQSINIPLESGVSFMFSGLFLRHCQNKSMKVSMSNDTFF